MRAAPAWHPTLAFPLRGGRPGWGSGDGASHIDRIPVFGAWRGRSRDYLRLKLSAGASLGLRISSFSVSLIANFRFTLRGGIGDINHLE